jgi:hypothetical protein
MARIQYFVTLHQDQWHVVWNDKRHGPYPNQKAAIKAAVDAAHKDGKAGKNAQVLVQGADHKFRTEWTYGNDPYPPPG